MNLVILAKQHLLQLMILYFSMEKINLNLVYTKFDFFLLDCRRDTHYFGYINKPNNQFV